MHMEVRTIELFWIANSRSIINILYLHVVLGDDPQEVDVVIRVEASHLLAADGFRPKNLHLAV